ncbi:MAG: hypothetical protein J1G04_04630 [Clostridiales bacterium]|nr:hypothetical protein [Clostridiales bacterium]
MYCKIRDNYGTNTQRGVSVISFTVTVADKALYVIDTTNNTKGTDVTTNGTYVEYTQTSVNGNYRYRLGKATSTSPTYDFLNNGGIYNKTANELSVFIPDPLTPSRTDGFTIAASDLFYDPDVANGTTYDVAGIKAVAADSANSAYYTITYNKNASTYGSASLYESITIKPTAQRPAAAVYVCVKMTAQSYEKSAAALIGAENSTVTLVFRIANTRPYYASATSAASKNLKEPLIELDLSSDANKTKDLKINDFLFDPDGTIPTYVTSGATFIKVPTNEFVYVGRENNIISLAATSNYYSSSKEANVVTNSYATGEGSVPTGFDGQVLAQAGSAAAATACVTYEYVNTSTLRLTARAATQYMYKNENRKGDFYFMVRINDPGDPSDTGIWYPIAVKVKSVAPTAPATTANFTLALNAKSGDATIDATNGTPSTKIITPISYYDAGGALHGVGTTRGTVVDAADQHVDPFLADADAFSYKPNDKPYMNRINDIVALDGESVNNYIDALNTNEFFTVKPVQLYAAAGVFSGLTASQLDSLHIVKSDADYYSFTGLEITPLKSTGNYFFEFDVNVVDSHGVKATIGVYVKVANTAINVRRDPNSGTSYAINPAGGVSSYVNNTLIGEKYIEFKIEKSQDVYLTPYDFAYDFDTADGINPYHDGGFTFNSNPADKAAFESAAAAITKTFAVKRTADPAVAATAANVMHDQLSFTSTEDFENRISAGGYASAVSGRINGIPYIMITGKGRTNSYMLRLSFSVTDGYTVIPINIVVTVVNAKPVLQSNLAPYYAISAGTNTYLNGSLVLSEYEFTVGTLVYDEDDDPLSFVSGTVRVVAKHGEDYYTKLDADFNGVDEEDRENKAVYILSDYITAILTKDRNGRNVIKVTALSSTQLFNKSVYLEFEVSDSTVTVPLRVQIEVVDSKPEMVVSGDRSAGIKASDDGLSYTWYVKYDSAAEKTTSRYIINDKELYDSPVISASASNKLLLFDDPDKQQTVMLNAGGEKGTANHPVNQTNGLVKKAYVESGKITEDIFGDYDTVDQYPVVAIAPTYYTPTQGGNIETKDDSWYSVNVLFFEKSAEGMFTKAEIVNWSGKYWAIEIKDPRGEETGPATQIAIATRDSHNGREIYLGGGDNRTTAIDDNNDKSLNVINFYFDYEALSLTKMHEQYRTDGRSESTVDALNPVDGSNTGGWKIVDRRNVRGYQFASGELPFTNAEDPSAQEALQNATFSERFKYQYFIDKGSTKSGNDEPQAIDGIVAKKYTETPFYYEPISITAAERIDADGIATYVPISYLAMPSVYSSGGNETSNATRVIFGNNTTTNNPGDFYEGNYLYWAQDQYKDTYLPLVYENVSLTDGKKTWSGDTLNDNDYIKITYTTVSESEARSKSLVNIQRSALINGEPDAMKNDRGERTIFREDKYGFNICKKAGGKRPTGALKLTVKLKTTGENSTVEDVSVDIVLRDSKPTNFQLSNNGINTYSGISVTMDTSDTAGKYVFWKRQNSDEKLTDEKTGQEISASKVTTLTYQDADSNDTLKFFMLSATDHALEDVLTDEQITYIASSTNASLETNGFATYFDVDADRASEYTAEQAAKKVPNPGYQNFFTVSPVDQDASALQIIPKAKTQLNIATQQDSVIKQYLDENHLEADIKGGSYVRDGDGAAQIYYPFKVLYYDDCENTGITNGWWGVAVIKVYIGNYKMTKAFDQDTYSLSLQSGVKQTVDISTLVYDKDIGSGKEWVSWSDAEEARQNLIQQGDKKNVADNLYLLTDYLVLPVTTADSNSEDDVTPEFEYYDSTDKTWKNGASWTGQVKIYIPDIKNNPTIMVVEAIGAFKGTIQFRLTFRDSGSGVSDSLKLPFSFSYQNTAPERNDDTYNGQQTISIVMKTNDSFTLFAGDATMFDKDKAGGYSSPDAFKNKNWTDYPAVSAKVLATPYDKDDSPNGFKWYTTSNYPEENAGNLGSLIIGQDDAASTLRFVVDTRTGYVGEFAESGDADMFDKESGHELNDEGSNAQYPRPMSVKLTARGVVTNAQYTVTLTDGDKTTKVVVIITVLSSAPEAMEPVLSKTDPVTGGTVDRKFTLADKANGIYDLKLNYGETFNLELANFVNDVDADDKLNFVMPDIYSGDVCRVENPGDSQVVSVKQVRDKFGTFNCLSITAIDYIIQTDTDYADVIFRVADAHGAQSDELHVRVHIAPRETDITAEQRAPSMIELSSYVDSTLKGETATVTLVSATRGNARLLYDPDADAPSAKYDVVVYALYEYVDDEIKAITSVRDDMDKSMIYKVTQRHGGNDMNVTPGSGEVYDYVSKYFELTVSDDGKQLICKPQSATVEQFGATTRIEPLKFYIVIGKQYTHDYKDTMGETLNSENAGGYANISVKDSAPLATENSGTNRGYSLKAETKTENVGGEDKKVTVYTEYTRQEDYRHFTGVAGDSITYKLYDVVNQDHGLFYDYDMLNAPSGPEMLKFEKGKSKVLTSYSDEAAGINITTVPEDAQKLSEHAIVEGSNKVKPPVLEVIGGSGEHADKITINILRKVAIDNPGSDGVPAYTEIPLQITCSDALGIEVSTVIVIRVENDVPEFKKNVTVDAKEGVSPAYSLTYTEIDGYELRATVRRNETLVLQLKDIIDDQDIDMDAYFFHEISGGLTENKKTITNVANNTLFTVGTTRITNDFGISTMSAITFTCVSTSRGEIVQTLLCLEDSTKSARTSTLTIILTVGNIRPYARSENMSITLMGVGLDSEDNTITEPYNILAYVYDDNEKDRVIASDSDSETYVFISEFSIPQIGDVDEPIIYGPGLTAGGGNVGGGGGGGEEEDGNGIMQVCSVTWADDTTHQTFAIMLTPGVYGTQKVFITVTDGGYIDGAIAGVTDFLSADIEITITVTRPINDMDIPELSIARGVNRTITSELLLNTPNDPNNADGYVIADITTESNLEITHIDPNADVSAYGLNTSANTDVWKVRGRAVDSNASITVKFDVGGLTVQNVFKINIADNRAPVLREDPNKGIFTVSRLNDSNMITIRPEDWFTDPDEEDVMSFKDPVKVRAAVYADATLEGRNIVLTFKGRGTTDLTFNITDESGTMYTHTITIGCTDMAELSWFNSFIARVQTSPLMWGLIFGGILLLIIILIIILIVVHKKRKVRAEIEALLNSEAELEEELLRLSGGGMNPYQSFGYLPPTQQTMNNPNLMIGSNAQAPQDSSLQLNAGTGAPQQGVNPMGQQGYDPMGQQGGGDGFDPNSF